MTGLPTNAERDGLNASTKLALDIISWGFGSLGVIGMICWGVFK